MNTSVDDNSTLFVTYPVVYTVITAVYAANFFLGAPSYGYIVWLIVAGQGRTLVSEFFTLNLAVSEIIYCLSNALTCIFRYTDRGLYLSTLQFSAGFLTAGRALFQCCMCMDHYLAVVHPVAYLRYKPLRYRVACSAVIWPIVICFCFSFVLIEVTLMYDMISGLFLISLAAQLSCCLAILRALKRPAPGGGGGGGAREREGMNSAKRAAFLAVAVNLFLTLISYVPCIVTMSLKRYLTDSTFDNAYLMSLYFCVMTGLVQPVLYLRRSGNLPCSKGP